MYHDSYSYNTDNIHVHSIYLQTEDQSNKSQNKEAKEHVDDGQDQIIVGLDFWLNLVTNYMILWLLGDDHLHRT